MAGPSSDSEMTARVTLSVCAPSGKTSVSATDTAQAAFATGARIGSGAWLLFTLRDAEIRCWCGFWRRRRDIPQLLVHVVQRHVNEDLLFVRVVGEAQLVMGGGGVEKNIALLGLGSTNPADYAQPVWHARAIGSFGIFLARVVDERQTGNRRILAGCVRCADRHDVKTVLRGSGRGGVIAQLWQDLSVDYAVHEWPDRYFLPGGKSLPFLLRTSGTTG